MSINNKQFVQRSANQKATPKLSAQPKGVNTQAAAAATIMLDQFYGADDQSQCAGLMLMSADKKVLSTLPLDRKITLIGRSRRNHIRINDPTVSISHLSISKADHKYTASDLNSSNGTYINRRRLNASQVLKDGDEIMLGATVLRFAAGCPHPAMGPAGAARPNWVRYAKKAKYAIIASVCCLTIWATALLLGFRTPPVQATSAMTHTTSRDAYYLSLKDRTSQNADISDADKAPPASNDQSGMIPTTSIRQALEHYSAGRIEDAIQILNLQAVSGKHSIAGDMLHGNRILPLFQEVRKLYDLAVLAQAQNKYTEAIEYWDQLLTVDRELIGDRPTYFSAEAKKQVQAISYAYALEAYQANNPQKAKQLCSAILQINPNHLDALKLMDKIDPNEPNTPYQKKRDSHYKMG